MTTNNNYDQSSTGLNIEATVYYDSLLAQRLCCENIEIIQDSGYSTSTVGYYINFGNVKGTEDITFTLEGTEEQIQDEMLAQGYDRDEYKAMIEGEPFDILETAYGEKITLLNYEDFNKVYAPLSAKPSKQIEKIISRGYSQGDYAEIYYSPEDLEKAWGNSPNKNELQTMINHYLWDSPIYASITLNDNEYSYSDIPNYDEYEWKREDFIRWVSDQSKIESDLFADYVAKDPSC